MRLAVIPFSHFQGEIQQSGSQGISLWGNVPKYCQAKLHQNARSTLIKVVSKALCGAAEQAKCKMVTRGYCQLLYNEDKPLLLSVAGKPGDVLLF